MSRQEYIVRNAEPIEFSEIGKLMVRVFSQVEGFPKETDQPDYYKTLANIGEITKNPGAELLVAVDTENRITGAVVYFSEMKYYGSGGIATKEQNTSGFRLLTVDPLVRGSGIGKRLVRESIRKADDNRHDYMIIHTTGQCNRPGGCTRSRVLKDRKFDFMQENSVLGFRLNQE
jgi:GNAT superfamily N-acetyltransferase